MPEDDVSRMAGLSDTAILDIRDLSAWYGSLKVLNGVTLHVNPGEIVGIFGHNGSGKTTLLNSIIGYQVRRTGSIRIGGEEAISLGPGGVARLGVGVAPQGTAIFGSLKIRENLVLGAAKADSHVAERLTNLKARIPMLGDRWDDMARDLSGGQRQLVSIGRALAKGPSVLLLDEPSVGLAPRLVAETMNLVRRLRDEEGTSAILVEQNIPSARKIIDRGYVIRQGNVVLEGGPEVFRDTIGLMEFF